MKGRIVGIAGPTATVDVPEGLKMYDRVVLGHAGLQGEVVRLDRAGAVVQVYEETKGLGVGEPVTSLGAPLTVRLGPGLLGAIFDGLQRPLERIAEAFGPFIRPGATLPPLESRKPWAFTALKQPGDPVAKGEALGFVKEGSFEHPVVSPQEGTIEQIETRTVNPEQPLARLEQGREITLCHDWPIRTPRPFKKRLPQKVPLITGQRAIDFLFPLARGGTAILPGGFGTGKTILEQAIAKFADVDIVVYVGCGERGNEMAEMMEEFVDLADPWSGENLMRRTIMVANTSNMPVAAREASIYTAVTIAEYYRDMGYHVLFLADSISRWAEALREISSALEEMPGEEGYPTYLASRLAGFFARAGVVETLSGRIGSLSMILSVSPPGGDFTEPATQACLRTTGAFLMLDTNLAHRRHFPAINWFQSFSLYDKEIVRHHVSTLCPEWGNLKQECQALLQREEKLREVAEIIGAEGLQDIDHLVMHSAERVRQEFLCQNSYTDDAFSTVEQTSGLINRILRQHQEAERRLGRGESLGEIIKDMH